jgi:predicted GNAT superfamily acetyltransferase
LDTDRFLACWDLNSDRVLGKVKSALSGQTEHAHVPDLPIINKVRQTKNGMQVPCGQIGDIHESRFLFELPSDIGRLKTERIQAAQAFQRQLRAVCLNYFPLGYWISDFFIDTDSGDRRCFYLFSRRE